MAEEPPQEPSVIQLLPIRRKPKDSPLPLIIGIALLLIIAMGAMWSVLKAPSLDEPWRITYEGVKWERGEDSFTPEGKRYLQAAVKFDLDVVSASDFQPFLAVLLRQANATLKERKEQPYDYIHIMVLNSKGQHVLDGVTSATGRFSITPTKAYMNQGESGQTPEVLPEAGSAPEATPAP